MSQQLINAMQQNLKNALRHGKWQEAQSILDNLKRADPTGKITRILELEYFVARGQWREAEGISKILQTLFADSSRFNFLAGRTAYAAKRYGEAHRFFEESHRQSPSRDAARWLGRTLTQLGKFAEAWDILNELLRSVDQLPVQHEAHIAALHTDLAWLCRRKGDLVQALQFYERAQQLKPSDSWLASEILKLRGDLLAPSALEEEIQQLKISGEPVPADLYFTWIEKLLLQGQIAEARMAFRDPAGPTSSSSTGQKLQMGWSCYRAGAYDMAFSLFLPLLSEHLGDFKFSNALEKAAAVLNRENELLECYEALAPSVPRLYGKIKKIRARSKTPMET